MVAEHPLLDVEHGDCHGRVAAAVELPARARDHLAEGRAEVARQRQLLELLGLLAAVAAPIDWDSMLVDTGFRSIGTMLEEPF